MHLFFLNGTVYKKYYKSFSTQIKWNYAEQIFFVQNESDTQTQAIKKRSTRKHANVEKTMKAEKVVIQKRHNYNSDTKALYMN